MNPRTSGKRRATRASIRSPATEPGPAGLFGEGKHNSSACSWATGVGGFRLPVSGFQPRRLRIPKWLEPVSHTQIDK